MAEMYQILYYHKIRVVMVNFNMLNLCFSFVIPSVDVFYVEVYFSVNILNYALKTENFRVQPQKTLLDI